MKQLRFKLIFNTKIIRFPSIIDAKMLQVNFSKFQHSFVKHKSCLLPFFATNCQNTQFRAGGTIGDGIKPVDCTMQMTHTPIFPIFHPLAPFLSPLTISRPVSDGGALVSARDQNWPFSGTTGIFYVPRPCQIEEICIRRISVIVHWKSKRNRDVLPVDRIVGMGFSHPSVLFPSLRSSPEVELSRGFVNICKLDWMFKIGY